MKTLRIISTVGILLLMVCGCTHRYAVENQQQNGLYAVRAAPSSDLSRFAPRFLAHGTENDYNRIGQPKVLADRSGKHTVAVDPESPTIYTLVRPFSTAKGTYTNYIYRVHFPEIPFSLIPFHLTAGDNVGLMVIITADEQGLPLLVTTVHTCGCYLSITPTTYLPEAFYPAGWQDDPQDVYGEKLPARLDYTAKADPILLVHLRPALHRVMNLTIHDASAVPDDGESQTMQMHPAEELTRLAANGDVTSLYYNSGLLKGHVRGSVKIWETLFLSLVSLDLFVGADKAYTDTAISENPFYTSLKPWNRNRSDMWYFDQFLQFWGWRL